MSLNALVEEIEDGALANHAGGVRNNLCDLTCSILAITFGFGATILAAVPGEHHWYTAAAAGLAALFTSIQKVIDFRGRSVWYFVKAAKLKGVALSLRHEEVSEAQGSSRYRAIEEGMEEDWANLMKSQESASRTIKRQNV